MVVLDERRARQLARDALLRCWITCWMRLDEAALDEGCMDAHMRAQIAMGS